MPQEIEIEVFDMDGNSSMCKKSSLGNWLPVYIRDREILRKVYIIIKTVCGTNHLQSSLWNVICTHDFLKALTSSETLDSRICGEDKTEYRPGPNSAFKFISEM